MGQEHFNLNYLENQGESGHILPKLGGDFAFPMHSECSVSIVIPAYNEEANIEKTLYFLLNQAFNSNEYEVFIVDNNSSDKTAEKIKSFIYEHKLTNFFYIKELEQGVSSARKRGYDEIVWRWKARSVKEGAFLEHLILSTDSDVEKMPEDWIERYFRKFLLIGSGLFVGNSDYDYKAIEKLNLPNLAKFLEIKVNLEIFVADIFSSKGEGNDMGFALSSYLKVGGVKILYYLENNTLYQTPSDDWNLSIDFFKSHEPVNFVDSGLFVSTRKYFSSIDEMLDGKMYFGDWGALNQKERKEIDIDEKKKVLLLSNQVRGIIAYRLLMNLYIEPKSIFSNEITDFLGKELIKRIKDRIVWAKKLFPETYYDDDLSYYVPSRYLYFYFGEEIHNLLREKFLELPLFSNIKEINVGVRYKDNEIKYDQYLAQLANKTIQLEKYFAEY